MGKSRKNKEKETFDPITVFVVRSTQDDNKWEPNTKRLPNSKEEPVGFYHVYQFKCDCNDPYYCEWETCNLDAATGKYEYCENPKCAGKPPLKPCNKEPILSPTPCYSAPGWFYGRYQCPKLDCGKKWNSSLALANKYQECVDCGTKAWAFEMTDEPTFEPGKGHIQKCCENCKDQPEPCRRSKKARVKKGRGGHNRYFLKHTTKNKQGAKSVADSKIFDGPSPPSAAFPKTPEVAIKTAILTSGQTAEVTKKKNNKNKKKTGGAKNADGGSPVASPKVVSATSPKPPTVLIKTTSPTSGQTSEVTKKKRKRGSRGGNKNNGDAPQVKSVSPAPTAEGEMVKFIQDFKKMAFPKQDNDKAPKIN